MSNFLKKRIVIAVNTMGLQVGKARVIAATAERLIGPRN